jgi:hypothetical protein
MSSGEDKQKSSSDAPENLDGPEDGGEEREEGFIDTSKDSISQRGPRFAVDIQEMIDFVFPKDLQHPLTAARLFVYADYGPLDADGFLRSGIRGSHIVSVWELDSMCSSVEREDVISIYLHNKRELGLLSKKEQEAIIQQADGHLKRAKGKAMLPQISVQDIVDIFEDLERDVDGLLSFHQVQTAVSAFRESRVKQYKLVYPSIGGKKGGADNAQIVPISSQGRKLKTKTKTRGGKVSDAVAPVTMFQHDEGVGKSEVIDVTNKLLCKHASFITEMDNANDTSVVANVRLLRGTMNKFPDPYVDKRGRTTRDKWNQLAGIGGVSIGSKVKASRSSSTWKQKVTVY